MDTAFQQQFKDLMGAGTYTYMFNIAEGTLYYSDGQISIDLEDRNCTMSLVVDIEASDAEANAENGENEANNLESSEKDEEEPINEQGTDAQAGDIELEIAGDTSTGGGAENT